MALLKAICVVASLWNARVVSAQAPSVPLSSAIRTLVDASGLADRVALSVLDLETGSVIGAVNEKSARNPASNMKLLTAAVAMSELGPDFRMRTALLGRIEGSGVVGGLCLKGSGDPTLRTADLIDFATRLADEGVRRIDEIIIDGTYFDAQVLPPAFDQQPNEVASFRAAIAALSVNENAYTLRVRPGPGDGTPVVATVDAPLYFELDNGMTTAPGNPNVIADQRDNGETMSLRLRGTLPLGTRSLAFSRRVDSPLHYAGFLFIDVLRTQRIQVPKRMVVGACPSEAPLITTKTSPPLAEILDHLGKDSDNFVAEMVLKVLGAERKRKPGRSADGAVVVLETLARMGVSTDGLKMVNGSGLFEGNAVSARQLAALLAAMHRNTALRDEFIAHLAVGGEDGTLSRRFSALPAPRIVRAKTGTLNSVISLSGYVLGPTPRSGYAFAYLANGVAGKQAESRALIDKVVEALAAQLYPKKK